MPGWFNKAQRPPLEELPDVSEPVNDNGTLYGIN